MNLLRLRKFLSAWANLRSRGDEPSPKVTSWISTVKPPLTRRWTPFIRSVALDPEQTSAHAEMDLSELVCELPEPSNLRSRGDGPDMSGWKKVAVNKPPLMRRWAPKSDGRTCGLTLRTYPPVVVSYDSSLNVDVGNRCPWQRKWIRNRGQLSQAHFCELLADV